MSTSKVMQSRGRRWLSGLAAAGAAVVRGLRLVGSQCCVGRSDAAWRRARDREPDGS